MENTQEQNTPEQWFQILKEPYRSEAIVNIDKEYAFFKDYPESLEDALENSFNFFDHDQAKWITIFNSIRNGETTYLEPEKEEPTDWEAKYNELKAKYDQLQPKGEKVYFYFDKDNENVWTLCPTLQVALNRADENQVIYEAYCIGKKKSVLVNK